MTPRNASTLSQQASYDHHLASRMNIQAGDGVGFQELQVIFSVFTKF